jgi:hypothetical protein
MRLWWAALHNRLASGLQVKISRLRVLWNPTLAQRARKSGAVRFYP